MKVTHAFFARYWTAIVRSAILVAVATMSCILLGGGEIIAADPSQMASAAEQPFIRVAQRTSSEIDFSKIEAVPIFDGKTLEGWEGDLEIFRVEQGAVIGRFLETTTANISFLCTLKEYEDFELRLKVKMVGEDTNGGIQFRSQRVPDSDEVSGYQADAGHVFWGCLYDEARRGRVLACPDPEFMRKDLKRVDLDIDVNEVPVSPDAEKFRKTLKWHDWNDYVIRCVGNRVQLWVNGNLTSDYIEKDESIPTSGVIGLQVHDGPPTEVWYKDITIKVAE